MKMNLFDLFQDYDGDLPEIQEEPCNSGRIERLVMQKILSASRRFGDAARKKLEAELNNGFESRVVSELERLSDSSGNAPESAV